MTISDGAGSFAQGKISDEKNRKVAASVSAHSHKLWISLLLQCLPVSLASYCSCSLLKESSGAVATGD